MKKDLVVLILLITMLAGCGENIEESVVYENATYQEGRQSTLNNDALFDKMKINNVNDFTIYFAHYVDGKEIKRYELVLDENKKNKINLDVIYSISNIENQEKTKTINFIESSSVYRDTITMKNDDKDLKSLKVNTISLSKDKKNILGGVYLDDKNEQAAKITISDLSKIEAILLIFEYNDKKAS